MQRVIGISLGNNASACVVGFNGVELAISEERLINEKNTKKFPINAITMCVNHIKDNYGVQDEYLFMISSYEVINNRSTKYMVDLSFGDFFGDSDDFYDVIKRCLSFACSIPLDNIVLRRVDHHEAHRLSAAYMSGFLNEGVKTLSITYDGFGDGICASIYDWDTRETLARVDMRHSLALVYQFVTGALGFKEHQHEGKITGLAAFGKPLYTVDFKYIINYNSEEERFVGNDSKGWKFEKDYNKNIHQFAEFKHLKNQVYKLVERLLAEGATREDIACSVQMYVEDLLIQWINDILARNVFGVFNLTLSGGLFANVKINWEIKENLEGIRNLFVLPPMGDEGTCIGAAIKGIILEHGEGALDLEDFGKDCLYLGPKNTPMSFDEINSLSFFDHGYSVYSRDAWDDLDGEIANFIAQGKIVCISEGYQEFGPRALCNHSILYDASKYDTNKWLNDRLGRTEFMPFAPVCMDKFEDDLFKADKHGLHKTLKYMTIILPVSEEFARDYKAACHIDGTARPQILSRCDNWFMYNILERYYHKTRKKAVINTSFNLHNHPIIFDDRVAIQSFVDADLDVLLLENALIVKREET